MYMCRFEFEMPTRNTRSSAAAAESGDIDQFKPGHWLTSGEIQFCSQVLRGVNNGPYHGTQQVVYPIAFDKLIECCRGKAGLGITQVDIVPMNCSPEKEAPAGHHWVLAAARYIIYYITKNVFQSLLLSNANGIQLVSHVSLSL